MSSTTTDINKKFTNGSTWLKADFHLHTKADKEFKYTGNQNEFVAKYIAALKSSGTSIGVITNHNKFDFGEFKALRSSAKKEGIFLLPGVELSVNDGANGIHTLIVFSDEWIANGNDYINPFLTTTFSGKTPSEYENENGRSSQGLIETIKQLEGYHKDFFLIFAHVEQRSGLWKELNGGRIEELGNNKYFCRRTLGFQKVRTNDERIKVQKWLGSNYPIELEGSDCKSLNNVGLTSVDCYLKVGDFTFEAIKFALSDHKNRVCNDLIKHDSSYIISASFEGGTFNGQTINFSSELNTLIGIRGSGKSSILEAVRYCLNIPFGEKSPDQDYKEKLVGYILGSGGKITIKAVDQRGVEYEIRRIYKEQPDVYVNGTLHPGISIRDTILKNPIYFGQKDLSSTSTGFEKDLVEKLVGENLSSIRNNIDERKYVVSDVISKLKKVSDTEEKRKEYKDKITDATFKLKYYKEHGVEEKLKKQINFDSDARKCSQIVEFLDTYLSDLDNFINQYEDDLKSHTSYKSKQNSAFFSELFAIYNQIIVSFQDLQSIKDKGQQNLKDLAQKNEEFYTIRKSLREEFATIERTLAEELKLSGAQAIRTDEFRDLQKIVEQSELMLKALDKQEANEKELGKQLLSTLSSLNDLWLEEYNTIKKELDAISNDYSFLDIDVRFKEDKEAFVGFMKDIFRGSRIRESHFVSLSKEFSDFADIYKRLDEAKKIIGSSSDIFETYFIDNISLLLTWKVPNSFTIKYRGKELKHHSLGQRASALILFVLSQKDNDVIIIDQPEDDLDNQTIYEDVIKIIRQLKPTTQFILATHNANFPVLGDAEQVISCTYSDNSIEVRSGSIDRPMLQQEIVNVMEGGEEAFKQRKRIYEIWKPQNS